MTEPECLTTADLVAFQLGELPEGELSRVAAHLESCPTCDEAAATLDTLLDPTLAAYRRSALAGPPALTGAPPGVPGYEILSELGRGGMGVVYQARHERLRRVVALKMLLGDHFAEPELRQRFRAEAEAVARLQHPNIAQLYEVGVAEDGRPFFAMEFIRGLRLDEYARLRSLAVPDRLALLARVCDGVQHAHDRGVIHRDLKPANVLVDETGQPRVLDFGVARATGTDLLTGAGLTRTGQVLGTPSYMSPEQVTADPTAVDHRADVYALGVILFELLAHRLPYRLEGRPLAEAARLIAEEDPPRLGSLDPGLRGDVETIVEKALAKEPARRYPSAADLAADLRRFLSHEPILARPPSALYHLRQFTRRHKALVGGVLATGVALVLGLVATGLFALAEARQRSQAEHNAQVALEEKREAQFQAHRASLAAAAEKAANEQTQKRLAQIEKGVVLFAGMLRGIHPRLEELGGDPLYVQLRKRAEHAADALDAEAVGDSLAVARLQTILGATLLDLGGAAKAGEVLEKARATRERELGGEHPDTLDTLAILATAYQDLGKSSEAIALLEQVRDAQVKQHGADHPATLTTIHNLIGAYQSIGKLPEAISLYEQLHDSFVKTQGADHANTLTTLNNLAGAYRAAGKLPEAITLFEQVREARVKKLGADHPDTLVTLNNLGEAYRNAGKLPEAINLLEQARDGRVEKLGADHPATLTTLNNLALAYQTVGRLPEAVALFEQAATGVAGRRFLHEHAGPILFNTSAAYEQAGQFDKAEGWRRQWLAVLKQKAEADSPAYANDLAMLGVNLLHQKKWSDAEPILRECLAIREKKQPDDWRTFNTRSMLGGALLGQKKYADAEPLLLAGYEGMKRREKAIPPQARARLAETLDRLIELSSATKKPDEAAKWQAERAKYPSPKSEPDKM